MMCLDMNVSMSAYTDTVWSECVSGVYTVVKVGT